MITDTLACLISPAWMSYAECRYTDPDVFYPSVTGKWNKKTVETALKVCRRCPVSLQCLEWAYEINDGHAILGGTTPEMRSQFMKSFDKIAGGREAA